MGDALNHTCRRTIFDPPVSPDYVNIQHGHPWQPGVCLAAVQHRDTVLCPSKRVIP